MHYNTPLALLYIFGGLTALFMLLYFFKIKSSRASRGLKELNDQGHTINDMLDTGPAVFFDIKAKKFFGSNGKKMVSFDFSKVTGTVVEWTDTYRATGHQSSSNAALVIKVQDPDFPRLHFSVSGGREAAVEMEAKFWAIMGVDPSHYDDREPLVADMSHIKSRTFFGKAFWLCGLATIGIIMFGGTLNTKYQDWKIQRWNDNRIESNIAKFEKKVAKLVKADLNKNSTYSDIEPYLSKYEIDELFTIISEDHRINEHYKVPNLITINNIRSILNKTGYYSDQRKVKSFSNPSSDQQKTYNYYAYNHAYLLYASILHMEGKETYNKELIEKFSGKVKKARTRIQNSENVIQH